MITTVVTIKLPENLTREQWLEAAKKLLRDFRAVPGLIRKQADRLHCWRGRAFRLAAGTNDLLQNGYTAVNRRERIKATSFRIS